MSDIDNHAYRHRGSSSSPDKPSSRGSGHESTRVRRRDGDRKGFHDHRQRDYNNGGFRGRGKFDDSYNRHRSRDYDRHNDFVRDGDTRHKHGSHSRRSRRESRSRSRSPSHSESKKTSGFDMAPPAAGAPAVSGQMPGIAHMIQGTTQNLSPFGISQIGALSLMQVQPMTQQATRHARRVYVGGLPPFTNEQVLYMDTSPL